MADGFGISFSPTDRNLAENAQRAASQTPLQDAIKLISMRIPKFVGAQSIVPGALLNAPGAAGVPGISGGIPGGLDEFLRRLFGQRGGGFGPGPSVGESAGFDMPPQRQPPTLPIPRIVPGSDTPPQPPDAPWNPRPPQPIGPIGGAPAPRPAPPPLGPQLPGRWRTY